MRKKLEGIEKEREEVRDRREGRAPAAAGQRRDADAEHGVDGQRLDDDVELEHDVERKADGGNQQTTKRGGVQPARVQPGRVSHSAAKGDWHLSENALSHERSRWERRGTRTTHCDGRKHERRAAHAARAAVVRLARACQKQRGGLDVERRRRELPRAPPRASEAPAKHATRQPNDKKRAAQARHVGTSESCRHAPPAASADPCHTFWSLARQLKCR